MVELISYFKKEAEGTFEFNLVKEIAHNLLTSLNKEEILLRIKEANQPHASSSLIQNTFIEQATLIGFKDEAKGLFSTYENKLLRPDYYLKLGDKRGIILEVERGKTTINNMDLLDFWKCHICDHANYLFLMVPRELRQNSKMSPRKEFTNVSNRLKSFFHSNNYTNVDGLYLFGY